MTLKLKTADFRLRTRSRRLADPTQLADTLFRQASLLLAAEADGATRFRLIGVGADALADAGTADLPTLFEREFDASNGSRTRSTISASATARTRYGAAARCEKVALAKCPVSRVKFVGSPGSTATV